MENILSFVHHLIKNRLQRSNIAVDATAGNGYDTLLLAKHISAPGKVYAFDIQKIALCNTQKLLEQHHLSQHVEFILDSHENIKNHIKQTINIAIFNLGYLPKGDKTITTHALSSFNAIQNTCDLLAIQGIIAIVIYSGHPEGQQEKILIESWAKNLPQQHFQVLKYDFINRLNHSPYALIIERIK